jgi:hypothetical protein
MHDEQPSFDLAERLMNDGHYEEARAVLRALSKQPGVARYWDQLAKVDPYSAATARKIPRVNPERDRLLATLRRGTQAAGYLLSAALVVGAVVALLVGAGWGQAGILLVGLILAGVTYTQRLDDARLLAWFGGEAVRRVLAWVLGTAAGGLVLILLAPSLRWLLLPVGGLILYALWAYRLARRLVSLESV